MKNRMIFLGLIALSTLGCGNDSKTAPSVTTTTPPISVTPSLVAFDNDNKLEANIRWTTYGVPHITADNLQSLAFGSGYAYAKDNLCILADQIVKVRSERAKYFGPDKVLGSGDSANIISDFGHHALQVMPMAAKLYNTMSDNTRALIEGYVVGYNKYLTQTGTNNLAPECANKAWVKPITAQELTAYLFSTSQMASGLQFLDLAFFANPKHDNDYLPYIGIKAAKIGDTPQAQQQIAKQLLANIENSAANFKLPVIKDSDLGSNAWGLGKDLTQNGRGTLLANPHFPFTGHLRFWQSHLTIPGVMNIQGASLQGMPGVVNIGFNDNIAWSHTVSNSRRFVVYQLTISPDNLLKYQVDGNTADITKKTFYVEVSSGESSVILAKDYFYSEHGLMIETPAELNLMTWSEQTAFTLKDAAEFNVDVIDHWLALNLASNLEEFQQGFKQFSGIPWVNTIYADKQGNAFYIDKSKVLNLNDTALHLMRTDPTLIATRQAAGFDILPGNTALFFANGLNSYEQAPKLNRSDYVQNSNDSYWATNLAQPLSGYSSLYGDDLVPLSLRTRMSLTMLFDSRGDDNKFSAIEVENALLSNRSYLAEQILPSLLAQCQEQGTTPVTVTSTITVDVSDACNILTQWDGTMNQTSVGALIFREFAFKFNENMHFTSPFDSSNPANTPNNLVVHSSVITALATAIANIQTTGLSLSSALGDVQFMEKTASDGQPDITRFPWGGANNAEGGFNVFNTFSSDATLYPVHQYPAVNDVTTNSPLASGLTSQGYHLQGGSSWMFIVNFTNDGPVARGLITYSQATASDSPHFNDQSVLYSNDNTLRPILFNESDINNHLIDELNISH